MQDVRWRVGMSFQAARSAAFASCSDFKQLAYSSPILAGSLSVSPRAFSRLRQIVWRSMLGSPASFAKIGKSIKINAIAAQLRIRKFRVMDKLPRSASPQAMGDNCPRANDTYDEYRSRALSFGLIGHQARRLPRECRDLSIITPNFRMEVR